MVSLYETNVLNQSKVWKRILLHSNLPSALHAINSDKRRIVFAGIGSSYWAARISEFLWREYINPNCISIQSYDFVGSPPKYSKLSTDLMQTSQKPNLGLSLYGANDRDTATA